ncbi:hypothetical protein LCGC14_2232660, partial [marine sediment metagenome]
MTLKEVLIQQALGTLEIRKRSLVAHIPPDASTYLLPIGGVAHFMLHLSFLLEAPILLK